MYEKIRAIIKSIYVALCCTAASGMVLFFLFFTKQAKERDTAIAVGIFGAFLLFVLLILAADIGVRGKNSASWLTLGFGSWMTINTMVYLFVLHLSPHAVWAAGMLAAMAFITWRGSCAATGGRWKATLCWWLGSFVLPVCFVTWLNATLPNQLRFNLKKVQFRAACRASG